LFESAVAMGREALLGLHVPEEEVARIEADYRARDCERLRGQTATGDLHTLKERMYRPGDALAPAED
jgi:hypothetical protein